MCRYLEFDDFALNANLNTNSFDVKICHKNILCSTSYFMYNLVYTKQNNKSQDVPNLHLNYDFTEA